MSEVVRLVHAESRFMLSPVRNEFARLTPTSELRAMRLDASTLCTEYLKRLSIVSTASHGRERLHTTITLSPRPRISCVGILVEIPAQHCESLTIYEFGFEIFSAHLLPDRRDSTRSSFSCSWRPR